MALLLILTSVASAAIERSLHGDIHWMYLLEGVLGSIVALLLWRHRAVSLRWSLLSFVLLLVPVLLLLWVWSIDSRVGALTAIQAGKLILLGIALLAPSAMLALALIALLVAQWAFLLERFQLLGDPIHMASGEPWVTLLYVGAALLLVGLRWKNLRLERQLYASEAEAQTLREVKQVSIAIRDEISTPLQNLELSITALRQRHPEEALALERMRRAVQRLIALRPLAEDAAEVARLRALRQRGERLEDVE